MFIKSSAFIVLAVRPAGFAEAALSAQVVQVAVVQPCPEPAVFLQHSGSRERAWRGAATYHHKWHWICARSQISSLKSLQTPMHIFCSRLLMWWLFFLFPGSFSKHEFQAETKKLLDIVARSLYSEKEVRGKRELHIHPPSLFCVTDLPDSLVDCRFFRCSSGSWFLMAVMLWKS